MTARLCVTTVIATKCISLRKLHRKLRLGLPRLFDRLQYEKLNVIERLLSWLKVGYVSAMTSWPAASNPWLHWPASRNAYGVIFQKILKRWSSDVVSASASLHQGK
jgi:hypothetical protein